MYFMQLLPSFDEEKKSLIFTIVICAFLGISFVLFIVAYRNLKAENSFLKSQVESGEKAEIAKEAQPEEVASSATSQFESETNKIETNLTNSVSPTPTPIVTVTTQPTPTAIPTPTPIPFITTATLNIEPANGDVCGTNFKFRGYITSSGQGSVAYRWKRTDAENVTMEPYPTVTFESAGTKEVNYYLTLTKNTDAEAWFEITSPESVSSNRARFVQQNC